MFVKSSTWLALVFVSCSSSLWAQTVVESSPDLDRIDIVEHPGAQVPLDLTFIDDSGNTVHLKDYFGQGRPVVLMLGYYQCPMLCNLVWNGMVDGINLLEWQPGVEFTLLTVSINPSETHDLALAKKESYLSALDAKPDPNGWRFLVGEESQSEALAEAVGFKYFYDTERKEYAHPAAAFVLTEKGIVSRYLYGIHFSKTDLKLSLLEASEGTIGSTVDRLLLYCYHYDPNARGYVLVAANVMKLGGAAALIALGTLLAFLWYGERHRRRTMTTRRTDTIKGRA